MTTTWNGAANFAAISDAAYRGVLAAALHFESTLRLRLAVPNPPPHLNSSKPGEYPRLRTGAGQKALTHMPASVAEVRQLGYVRVGYVKGAGDHMLILELARNRRGLLDTLNDLKPTLAKLATAEFKG